MALRVFTSARAGLESTRGTNVTPTRLVYAEEWTHDQRKTIIRSSELRNSYSPVYSAAAGVEVNTVEASGRLSFDDAIWWANTHIKAVASGTGAGADKTWTFLPTHTSDDLKTATLQLGYSDTIGTAPGMELGYCLGDQLTLRFAKDDDAAVRFTGRFMSPEAATQITAFTGALSDRTTITASNNGTQVFIDAATIGSTADANVVSVEWTLNNNPVNLYTLNNSANAQDTFRPNHRTWQATITRYYRNDNEWDAYLAATERKIRVRCLGPSLGGSNYKIDLDLYGHYTARSVVDTDGLKFEQFTFEPVYDTTATTDFQLVVVNATASIT